MLTDNQSPTAFQGEFPPLANSKTDRDAAFANWLTDPAAAHEWMLLSLLFLKGPGEKHATLVVLIQDEAEALAAASVERQ